MLPKHSKFTQTIKLLETYLQSYAFIDTALNPNVGGNSYNQDPVDLLWALRDIRRETYNNTFDFYERLMVLFNSMKETHTYFVPPCIQKFAYVLPYIFSIFPDENGTQHVRLHYQIDPAIKLYNDSRNIMLNYDTEILYINIKGKPIYNSDRQYNDGTYPAAEAMAIWADSEVSTARSSAVRQNIAASGDFSFRPASTYQHPQYDNISCYYRRPNSTGEGVAVLPFYVIQQGNVNSFASECPINDQPDKNGLSNEIVSQIGEDKKKVRFLSLKGIYQWITGRFNKKQQNDSHSTKPTNEQIIQFQKTIELGQQKQTLQLKERLHPKLIEDISKIPGSPENTSSLPISPVIKENNNIFFHAIPISSKANADPGFYYLEDLKIGIVVQHYIAAVVVQLDRCVDLVVQSNVLGPILVWEDAEDVWKHICKLLDTGW
ncbi:MAG: hypothetical protein EZS28_025519, partial [Streblomastix strix]